MGRVLIPIPSIDFDPTETAVPWRLLTAAGHEVRFATPDARPGRADDRMLSGHGLGPWKPLLIAHADAREAYALMIASPAFQQPQRHDALSVDSFDGLLLPGGHAPGMKAYLESRPLQALVAQAFERAMPVGAICHGVVLAARARRTDGRSVLHGLRTTALTRAMELSAWALTALWLGGYYRTYPMPVQDEVEAALARRADFASGPLPLARDSEARPDRGFVLRDGHYLSARWPGDAHRFAIEFDALLRAACPAGTGLA